LLSYWKYRRDEQHHLAASLKKFVDIEVSTELSELRAVFERAVGPIDCEELSNRCEELDFNGASFIEKTVLEDLGLSESAGSVRRATEGRRVGP